MNLSTRWRFAITVTLVALAISTAPIRSHGATEGSFATANNAINNAFSSLYSAEQNGGELSTLVEKLNTAISSFQKAAAENVTNPSAATADLTNSTAIAQIVSMDSASFSSSGSAARQLRLYESLFTIAGTLSIAALTYLRGDRVYRRFWLFVYRNHLVEKKDE